MSKTNTCFVVGNLGNDPIERGRTEKSGPVVGFTVAENVQTFDQESKTYKTLHTNWFPVTAFGNTAERIRKHLKKGDRVAIQGRMKIAKYADKAGEERSGFEIIADDVAVWKTLPSANASPQAGSNSSIDEPLPF